MIDLLDELYIMKGFCSFSCELIFGLVCFLNVTLYVFFKKLKNTPRFSNLITMFAFCVNIVLLFVFGFLNANRLQFGSSFFDNTFFIEKTTFFYKGLINLFLLGAFLSFKKAISRFRFYIPKINAYFCLIALFSSLLPIVRNSILAFILLDFIIFSIYFYASFMRTKRVEIYSLQFVLINIISTLIFYITYFALYKCDYNNAINALNIAMAITFFLKIGFFPLLNYLLIKNHKNNLPYIFLICSWVPFVALFSFMQIFEGTVNSDIFQQVILLFLVLNVAAICTNMIKAKTVAKFTLFCGQIVLIFAYLNFIVSQDSVSTLKLGFSLIYSLLAVFSLFAVLKSKNEYKKITFSSLKGLVLTDRKISNLLILSLLFLSCAIPSALSKNSLAVVLNIYSYDKSGYIFALIFFVVFALVLFRIFEIISNIYTMTRLETYKNNKKTTLNCIVFLVVIMFLIFGLFL